MELEIHRCKEGGILYEFFRREGVGQLAIRSVPPGVEVGNHVHPLTNEWWLIFSGECVVWLEKPGPIRELVYVAKWPRLFDLPAGTGHALKNMDSKPVYFIFFADRLYDPKTHDVEPWERWKEQ